MSFFWQNMFSCIAAMTIFIVSALVIIPVLIATVSIYFKEFKSWFKEKP